MICDVTDRTEVYKTAEFIQKTIGDIDIFVSTIGIYPVKPVLSWTPQELYELFDTNVMAQFWVRNEVNCSSSVLTPNMRMCS